MASATSFGDFLRLIKIATVGEYVGAAWSQRSFLVNCSELATNARWFTQFKLLDIQFDESEFRKNRMGEYHRLFVPQLLERTQGDLLTTLEFAQTYQVEDDFVIFEYIKLLLLSNNDRYNTIQNQIVGVIDDVVNKELLLTVLLEQCFIKKSLPVV
ncbi:hypothetical protein HK096_007286 [Nowakowskiella sp. JEL0078]|nr:hypothetical protein HK096_007286 [Nowakowskiella sp. JEL0078]